MATITTTIDDYRARVAAARRAAPKSPWQKSDEALRELREGENAIITRNGDDFRTIAPELIVVEP
jgi:hypothetical protein